MYKNNDLVFTATVDDDGILDNSKRIGPIEEVTIKNPGPGLPEAGVYKIFFDENEDTIIKSITTNLHKIVFSGPVYVIDNADVYTNLVQNTSTTTLYTNNTEIIAKTAHTRSLQTFRVGTGTKTFIEPNSEIISTSTGTSTVAVFPKSDVIINGIGYFSFSQDQFFAPNKFRTLQVNSPGDIDLVDYVISPYRPPSKGSDGFYTVTRNFDVSSAVPRNGVLSWIISAPGLKDGEAEIFIKNISIIYNKKGWWNK